METRKFIYEDENYCAMSDVVSKATSLSLELHKLNKDVKKLDEDLFNTNFKYCNELYTKENILNKLDDLEIDMSLVRNLLDDIFVAYRSKWRVMND